MSRILANGRIQTNRTWFSVEELTREEREAKTLHLENEVIPSNTEACLFHLPSLSHPPQPSVTLCSSTLVMSKNRTCMAVIRLWNILVLFPHSSTLAWKNPMDGGAWWAAVHGVAKSRTRLSDFTFTFYFHALEKEMATHSSVLAWRIPGMGEPGGLPSMGSHRVGHD